MWRVPGAGHHAGPAGHRRDGQDREGQLPAQVRCRLDLGGFRTGRQDGFRGLDHDFRAAEILFNERQQEGVDRDFTFHVDRGKFDRILLEHAGSLGAKVFQGVEVADVDFVKPGDVRLNVKLGNQKVGIRTRMVVDASGRHVLLGRRLGLREKGPGVQPVRHPRLVRQFRSSLGNAQSGQGRLHLHPLPASDQHLGLADPDHRDHHQHRRSHAEAELHEIRPFIRRLLLGGGEDPREPLRRPESLGTGASVQEGGGLQLRHEEVCGDSSSWSATLRASSTRSSQAV